MGRFKGIVDEHDRQAAEKEKKYKEDKAKTDIQEKEDIQQWEQYLNDTIIPLLSEALEDLKARSYYSEIIKEELTDGRLGITRINRITFQIDLYKSKQGTYPNKALIIFSQSPNNSIAITTFRGAENIKGVDRILSITDGPQNIELVIEDFLKKAFVL